MILDLDGYRIKQGFVIREMGWCDRQGNADSIHFKSFFQYDQLPAIDKRQVNYVYKHIHALPFDTKPERIRCTRTYSIELIVLFWFWVRVNYQ